MKNEKKKPRALFHKKNKYENVILKLKLEKVVYLKMTTLFLFVIFLFDVFFHSFFCFRLQRAFSQFFI